MTLRVDPLALESRVALVTGAARGIGRAIALVLAGHGADIVITDLPADAELLEHLQTDIEDLGRRAHFHAVDISGKTQVEELVRSSLEAMGRIDILINNAGIHLYPSPLLRVSETDWDRVLAVNVKGPLFLSQAVLPRMIERKAGAVVNVASDSAFDVIADEGVYGISKIALVRMTAYLAKELSGTGVRANSIAPGWVHTRLTEPFRSDAATLEGLMRAVPCGRMAEPDEIARAVLFLASDLSSYVNGHCLVVDGGRIAGVPA